MKNYTYQNNLIGKKQLRQLLAWSFTNYNSMQACALADELKYLGFKYATQAGISISIEDLKIPFIKNLMLEKANQDIINAEKIYLKGKITDVERFQKIIDTWSLTSESLKEQVIYYFKNYDPLNSVYIMAFSGARGNLSQVRQLVGMRGLMSDPSGEIMKLPIKKNFREGLTITDYLMSGYGARKGIVDTALKTANSGYLTRRLIDVGQDILIREKDCLAKDTFLFAIDENQDLQSQNVIFEKVLGRVLSKPIFDTKTNKLIAHAGTQITPKLIQTFKEKKATNFYIRSPFTCNLYRAICQKCYGWDLANETLVDIGEAVGILAGQSIGEPGTQLTMRTFHTGGIFTSEARQQIVAPVNGILRFYKILKTVILRTNRGEDVLITKNSGSIILIPEDKNLDLIKIEVLRNTIIFPKNNQYILKDTVIGELVNTNKQIKNEVKPILSDTCGEIFMPRLKKKVNLLNNNKLLWILSGQLYNSPLNSFINFYPDYKLNKNSFIFRTKIINHYDGIIEVTNKKQDLYQRLLRINNHKYSIPNTTFKKLTTSINQKNYLLNIKNSNYLVKIFEKTSKFYLELSRNQQFGISLKNSFKTLTGGTIYYDHRNLLHYKQLNESISYINRNNQANKYNPLNFYRTMIWLSEELHQVNCEPNIVLVEHGDFISEKFELIPGLFSKTSGIVTIRQKNNLIQTISIKSGLVYEGKKFKSTSKKLYYPGEVLFSNIPVSTLSFCEQLSNKNTEQLLVRPIEIYEFPYNDLSSPFFRKKSNCNSVLSVDSQYTYSYKPNQSIKGTKNLLLISNSLAFKSKQVLNKTNNIELIMDKESNSLNFYLSEKLSFNSYMAPDLRYKNIQSSTLIQQNQFIDKYTILGYLEAITLNSLEIVKIKIKKLKNKPVLLISNDDCFILNKKDFPEKKLNNFIINNKNVNSTGKIIIENDRFFTLQKGRPYFFPNCTNDALLYKTNLQYKTLAQHRIFQRKNIKQRISVNYQNILKLSLEKINNTKKTTKVFAGSNVFKTEFSKLFLKRNGKLYSALMPQFFKKFSITTPNLNFKANPLIRPDSPNYSKMDRTLLLQSSETIKNQYRSSEKVSYQLTLVKFLEQPFIKTTKAVGLHSITEDYFEQDVNSVFCKNSEFIETGETIGLLNLEKEITGDIVQGLPRIEEILEARKKNVITKKLPTSQKKGLLIQKTTIDPNFEFRKIGTSIKENERINPHKLLKVYFNYYGLVKSFICDRTKKIKYSRLIQNYEGSYRSFKKVQSFILNSVQSVYQSQGVTINDKHLEVIIKQMTTKVLITYEGNTPLLRREVVDLYHIQYINKIIKLQEKEPASYVPLLLGITKAALNNPSFISAASFQETTRVLTKAAIEGRIDWLRGLKENIIIGHLIPAGTGSQNYRNCFNNRTFEKLKTKK
uniref:DNA-directed RNA polymerase subunit beta'' n=1 Tax=Halamphora coffeiformis TaxID=1487565 RepID=A0A516ZBP6_9STRA|nr:RNA polymerase beta' subunit [Halamphora coffeaeformis]QDR25134.1 RNA polymerase beta' subunit [Halamphora coffeaeformis]